MARIDRLKEEVGWLKVVLGILAAIDASLLAWLAQNYTKASGLLLFGDMTAIIVVTFALVRVNRLAYRRIEQMEDA
jgi:hypothetical protein